MSSIDEISREEVDGLFEQLNAEAKASGYFLNPDRDFAKDLVRSLIVNKKRYGYPSCPCRLSSGARENDLDIVCPCDYRDPDLDEFGACYCALYVSEAVLKGEERLTSIPERRLPPEERKGQRTHSIKGNLSDLPYPVWRCKVCGYLCAREHPPGICPICKVAQDRFERFI
ncbi:MAG TPA: ferredoxin-thioredoxin reductase catalytic domain-containing protein [Syntrophorhabdaceae bacterium]|nr:ferredoxin-thioredoxin reductase catalytic domain-containing protein [Syntrophorhabdaceae bacterium]HQM82188.1 ferredoxin-thioredoxin reductase catalytic domain-containing protein [Syntrophorhabdaceae bacterium]